MKKEWVGVEEYWEYLDRRRGARKFIIHALVITSLLVLLITAIAVKSAELSAENAEVAKVMQEFKADLNQQKISVLSAPSAVEN